jgi:hypothetical protein
MKLNEGENQNGSHVKKCWELLMYRVDSALKM